MGKLVVLGISFLMSLSVTNTHAQDFKDCSELKELCFEIQNSPEKPFYLKGTDNNKVAILVHGLSDSSYFTKDIALLLNSQGYYIYSVLLSGHGKTPESLITTTTNQWLSDIRRTVKKAKTETGTKQVVMSGFSLGGVLVTSLAQDLYFQKNISKLILLAPAFRIKNEKGIFLCKSGAYRLKTWATEAQGSTPVKYTQMPFHAVCELVDFSSRVRDSAAYVEIPVFMAISDDDQTINTKIALETFSEMSSKKNKLFYIKDKKTSHTDINFSYDKIGKRKNPLFSKMSEEIIEFLK